MMTCEICGRPILEDEEESGGVHVDCLKEVEE